MLQLETIVTLEKDSHGVVFFVREGVVLAAVIHELMSLAGYPSVLVLCRTVKE